MTRQILFSLLALFLALASGCSTLTAMLDARPSASIKGVKLADFNAQGVNLLFDVEVSNPYEVPLPLANMGYSLASGAQPFLTGKADVAGTIPAKQSKRLTVPAAVNFAGLLKALGGVKPGSVVPYAASLDLSVSPPGVGPLSLPLKHEGEIPVPAVPEVQLTSVSWKNLSFEDATAVLKLNIKNTNSFAVDLAKLSYGLSLGGTKVAESSLASPAKFAAGGASDIEIPLSVKPINLGLAAFNMLRGSGANYEMAGLMNLGTPYGPLEMPYTKNGKTTFKR
ncbi:MAG: LEA type 2 family protein [Planctomycetota bacterium]|nr:LEA type 2 family protein [Planctomycetota bacterium]